MVSGLIAGMTWMSLDMIMIYFITISVNRFLKIIELENIRNSKWLLIMRLTSVLVRILIFITSISFNVTPFVIRLLYEEDYIQLDLDKQMLSTTLGKYLFHFINTEEVLANLVPSLFALIIVYLYYLTYQHSMSHKSVS